MTPQPPRTVDLFVSGRWQPPRAGQYEPATSPVTGEPIRHVAQGGPDRRAVRPDLDE
jgi:hypothetical protein